MYRAVQWVHERVPKSLQSYAWTVGFNSVIPFAGTTGIKIQHLDAQKAVVVLSNRRRVQNHIKGIHATAMATLVESATGMVFGQHVPDNTHIPLLKSMHIDYKRRAIGNLTATATMTDDQAEQIATTDRGAVVIDVKVLDEEGNEPIQCAMEWAWTIKHKK
jgi:acyl-coenzyme A thioesterase PaaI-like protein